VERVNTKVDGEERLFQGDQKRNQEWVKSGRPKDKLSCSRRDHRPQITIGEVGCGKTMGKQAGTDTSGW